jgi:acyl-coenzyme A synthetase/AMP-(fatty) acid ligase
MIDLQKIRAEFGNRCLFRGSGAPVDYAAFIDLVDLKRKEFSAAAGPGAQLFPHRLEWTAGAFAGLLARFLLGQNVFAGSPVPIGGLEPFLEKAPLLVLRTGGTTGDPRHVVHAADTLLSPYRIEPRPPTRLLILYAADHIAGIDAFFQALHRGSTLVIPSSLAPRDLADCLVSEQVQILPATPTFLQFLLLSGELEGRDLSQLTAIPHGAEPMPPALRGRIREAFPNARVLQRFGMTELGALPVRPDPDCPEALFLEESGYAWKVEDGELLIQSPTRMLGTLEDGPVDSGNAWHRTGDLAEATPRGSVRILGRREALINVGGAKIVPEIVEAMILEQPCVRDVAVSGMPNPLTGQALRAQVIFEGEPDLQGLMKALRLAAREKGLSLAHVPTRIEAVSGLDKTAIGKRARPRGKS